MEFHVFRVKGKLTVDYKQSATFVEFKQLFMEKIAGTPGVRPADNFFRIRDQTCLVDDESVSTALRAGGKLHVDVVSGIAKLTSDNISRPEAILQVDGRGRSETRH